jgi:hypothetical protein
MSFRELFGGESLSQVGTLYLDTLDHFVGKYSIIIKLINIANQV